MTSRNQFPQWLPEREVARMLRLSEDALRNWRSQDMRIGRVWPQPGRGGLIWRRFGRTVRYLLSDDLAGRAGRRRGRKEKPVAGGACGLAGETECLTP